MKTVEEIVFAPWEAKIPAWQKIMLSPLVFVGFFVFLAPMAVYAAYSEMFKALHEWASK